MPPPPPPRKFFLIFGLLRLVYSWGEIAKKLDDLLLNLVVAFGARRIRGVHDSASGHRGCIAAGYPRKARENKRSHTDSISPSLAAEGALHESKKLCFNSLSRSLRSLSLWLPCASGSIYVHVGHARVEFLLQEIELTRGGRALLLL